MFLGTVHQLAELMNLTPMRVQQLAQEGIIERDRRGQYDIVKCLSMYISYLKKWRSAAEIPCNIEDLARFLGLTKLQVRYLVDNNFISKARVGHGLFDLATGIREYIDFLRENYQAGGSSCQRGKKAPWRPPQVKSETFNFEKANLSS